MMHVLCSIQPFRVQLNFRLRTSATFAMLCDASVKRKRIDAVKAILNRNAQIIHALHGMLILVAVSVCSQLSGIVVRVMTCARITALQRSRTDSNLKPSAGELALAQEAKQNMVSLALCHAPNVGIFCKPGTHAVVSCCQHLGTCRTSQVHPNESKLLCPLYTPWACCHLSKQPLLQLYHCHHSQTVGQLLGMGGSLNSSACLQ